MVFGFSRKDKKNNDDPYWWGYIDDGQGWTARRKSEYMKTPAYNKELRRQMREEKKNGKGSAMSSSAYRKRY